MTFPCSNPLSLLSQHPALRPSGILLTRHQPRGHMGPTAPGEPPISVRTPFPALPRPEKLHLAGASLRTQKTHTAWETSPVPMMPFLEVCTNHRNMRLCSGKKER